MNFYIGFSSQGIGQGFNTRLVDSDLIKADIINNFSIRKGEVRGRPQFGSNLFNFIGQPFDEFSEQAILSDVETVLNNDPRLEINSLTVTTTLDSITFLALVTFLENKKQEMLSILIDNTGRVSIT